MRERERERELKTNNSQLEKKKTTAFINKKYPKIKKQKIKRQ